MGELWCGALGGIYIYNKGRQDSQRVVLSRGQGRSAGLGGPAGCSPRVLIGDVRYVRRDESYLGIVH